MLGNDDVIPRKSSAVRRFRRRFDTTVTSSRLSDVTSPLEETDESGSVEEATEDGLVLETSGGKLEKDIVETWKNLAYARESRRM